MLVRVFRRHKAPRSVLIRERFLECAQKVLRKQKHVRSQCATPPICVHPRCLHGQHLIRHLLRTTFAASNHKTGWPTSHHVIPKVLVSKAQHAILDGQIAHR